MPKKSLSSLALVLVLVLAIGTGACGLAREPGPLETDRGAVTYWLVTGTSVGFDACTDAESWQSDITPPEFPANSYLLYRISDDGNEAIAQSCETTLASSCHDSETGIVFDVSGHTLTYVPGPDFVDVMGSTCDIELDQVWVVEDQGEIGTMVVTIAIYLIGDATACATLDDQIIAESSNGLGFDGCTVTLSVDLEFDQTQVP